MKNTTLIKSANDFVDELTSHNVIEKDLNNNIQISKEYIDNNKAVRDILLQRGIKPESLPAS
jgi:DNA-damage-inducible protein D